MDKWNCAVIEQPEKLTVGEKFSISCQGENPVTFNKNVVIVFPQKKDNHRLYVLKSFQKDLHSLELKVVSYRTGPFDTPFIITDGNNRVLGDQLSFTVDSVLSGSSQAKPHPSFGPWASPWPLWRLSLLGAALLLFLAACFILGRQYIKRQRFIKTVKKRQNIKEPSKAFVKNLRRKDVLSSNYIKELNKLFRIFLEDTLFIPALQRSPSNIMKALKKYNKPIYKSHSKKIETLLNEITAFQLKKTNETINRELQARCLQLVFDLEERNI